MKSLNLIIRTTLVMMMAMPCSPFVAVAPSLRLSALSQTFLNARSSSSPNEKELAEQKREAVNSLAQYNDGTWVGVTIDSFSVTSDASAEPKNRVHQSTGIAGEYLYKTYVKTLIDEEGLKLQETFEWDGNSDEIGTKVKVKSLRLGESADVDSVDGSYSIDASFMDLPSVITSSQALSKFGIEHSFALSDIERVRCFVLYGIEDNLSRIVICNEKKVEDFDENIKDTEDVDKMVDNIMANVSFKGSNKPSQSDSISSMLEVKTSDNSAKAVDRLRQIQEAISGDENKAEGIELVRYPVSIFSLVGGVWLGDMVNREHCTSITKGRGFGSSTPKTSNRNKSKMGKGMNDGFAEWTTGVQKTAISYQWDYGTSIRQKNSFGSAVGIAVSTNIPMSSSGEVILNEKSGSARPLHERMIYVDFERGNYAGFVINGVLIKVPRFLSFSFAAGKMRNFYTEFAIFLKRSQEESQIDSSETRPPDLFCSRMTRLYGNDGQLHQASSSFFSLDRLNA